MLVWLLVLPLSASLLTAVIWPLAPRVREKCQELNLVSQRPGMKTRVMFRCFTRDGHVNYMQVWFDESGALDADERRATVLNVFADFAYWRRLDMKDLVARPCSLDTQSFTDCLQSNGDIRPEPDVRRDAEALAAAAVEIHSTALFPESIEGFSRISTRSQELSSFVPNWFKWTVGAFWITVGVIGLIVVRRSAIRVG